MNEDDDKRYTLPFLKREKYPYDGFIKFVWQFYYITLFTICKPQNLKKQSKKYMPCL